MYIKGIVRTRLIALFPQFTLQLQQVSFAVEFKSGDLRLTALIEYGFTVCSNQIGEAGERGIEICVASAQG
jgi:hypothetical protein